MWTCICGHQNADIGNFCVACGTNKNAVFSAQLGDDAIWFYYQGSHRFGPVSPREIAELLHAGALDRNTPVWKAGMNDWTRLYQTVLATFVPNLMPAAPFQAISDIYAWLLAILPLIVGTVLIGLGVSNLAAILSIWLLNTLFWALDVWEIKKTTGRFDSWLWTIFLLTPVYLFIRSGKAGQRYGYAVVWCILYICFIVVYAIGVY